MDDIARTTSFVQLDESLELPAASGPVIPDYLQDTYYWAYINPRNVRWLDREIVVRTILWQQHNKLQKLAFSEIENGQSVLQPASVYGSFAPNLAAHVGPEGRLDVVDVAQVQVRSVSSKLGPYAHAHVHHSNILHFTRRPFDVVVCYFLLHEVPDSYKYEIVDHLLNKVEPGGKVVFVDYHKPVWWHPLKLITSIVFDTLEPFAKSLWRNPISSYASKSEQFEWRQETIFAGLFQKVVATRL
ncbi:rhodoquinone biosynthesis methyltransferase RquA [Pseudomonadota bacterium]